MHFETIKRDEVLPMIEQAKNVKEQKEILCDLLDCADDELEELIEDLRAEKAKADSENNEAANIAPIKKGSYGFDEIKLMKKLLREGKSTGYIAKKLRRPVKNVSMRLAKLKKELEIEAENELCSRLESTPAPAQCDDFDAVIERDEELADIADYAKNLESEFEAVNEKLVIEAERANGLAVMLDKKEEELKDLRELFAWQTHRTHEQGEKCEALSDALAKALALIASLNRVIKAEVKADV